MDPSEHEQDLGRPSRRRRVLGVLLVVAAIAIPSVALAGGGSGSSGSLAPAPSDDDIPSIWLQDEGRDGKRGHDGRDCPFKHRNRGTGADQRNL